MPRSSIRLLMMISAAALLASGLGGTPAAWAEPISSCREPGRDADPPRLGRVNWSRDGTPIVSGTKVHPNDKIRIDIWANDYALPDNYASGGGYDPEKAACQMGIMAFQVLADGIVKDQRHYPPSECDPLFCFDVHGRQRYWYTTIEVKKEHAPILRLEVTATDHANNTSKKVEGIFPFGDWYGTIEWNYRTESPGYFDGIISGSMEFTLEHDSQGNLNGQLRGTQKEHSRAKNDTCPVTSTATDGHLTATLVGQYTEGRKLTIQPLKNAKFTPPRLASACPGAIAGPSLHAAFPAEFRRLLSDLQPTPDGGFQSNASAKLSGPAATTTMSAKLTLRPAVK